MREIKIKNEVYFGFFIYIILIGVIASCSESKSDCENSPCEPSAALSTFKVEEGFQIELFAAEPLIRDPVAMEVDEKGNIYTVEDPGYPEKRNGNGVVRLLKDTNGDGKPDSAIVFADNLRAPRGLMRWKDGILVTDAPDILYLEDTNGDGQADLRRVILTGFGYGNPQLGVNTPKYGIDNWIYVAHRQGNSKPIFHNQSDSDKIAGRGNIRFRPDTYEWESMAASSQFGHTFDAFGRPLYVLHNNHIYQEIIDARYLQRNLNLRVESATADISDHGTASEVFPITKNVRHELFTDTGVFTSACGITCYLGGHFRPDYAGATFVADPAHNLVHVDRIEESGITLKAQRMHKDREFLASTDRWFRPVNFYVGPDGALYVIDYYREIIEQPRFLSQEVLNSDMIYDGSNRGRIYRITSDNGADFSWPEKLNLQDSTASKLVSYLEHENIWWRRTSQRLLVDRKNIGIGKMLGQLARSSDRPEGRIHALWTLQGLNVLSSTHIRTALNDESPRVREHAVRLAELHLNDTPELARALYRLSDDSDLRVLFQLMCTLGNVNTPESHAVRRQILYDHIENEWMQIAALTAGDLDYPSLLEEAINTLVQKESGSRIAYFQHLGMLIGTQQETDDVRHLVETVAKIDKETATWWQAALLKGLSEAFQRGTGPDETLLFLREPMAALSLHPSSSPLRNAAQQLLAVVGPPSGSDGERIFRKAEEIIEDTNRDALLRADAVKLLNLSGSSKYSYLLKRLIDPNEPVQVQAAAVQAMQNIKDEDIGKLLLTNWNRMTPQVRKAAMETLLADDNHIRLVLDAVEQGQLRRSVITWNQTKRLMLHSDEDLRLRAQTLLGMPDEPRSDVIDRYMMAVEIEGDVKQGREVYNRTCAMCHQIEGEGGLNFGPDLASVRNNSPKEILVNILMPDTDITAGYEQWRIRRPDGSFMQGVITAETQGTITLRNPAGAEVTIPRDNIQTIEAIDESAMPTGLEQQISIEEMADLLEFLKGQ